MNIIANDDYDYVRNHSHVHDDSVLRLRVLDDVGDDDYVHSHYDAHDDLQYDHDHDYANDHGYNQDHANDVHVHQTH